MKKIFALMIAVGLLSSATQSFAQDTTKVKKTRVKKAKVATTTTTVTPPTTPPPATTTTTTTTPTKTRKARTTTVTPTPPPAPTPAPTVKTNPQPKPTPVAPKQGTNTSSDPVFGTDAKGRTIYTGKEGGHYYINANGHKEYVKKTS